MANLTAAEAYRAETLAARSADASYVDWPAIFAGTALAVALSFVLLTFGSAIGLSVASFEPGEGVSLRWIGDRLGHLVPLGRDHQLRRRRLSRRPDAPPGRRRQRRESRGPRRRPRRRGLGARRARRRHARRQRRQRRRRRRGRRRRHRRPGRHRGGRAATSATSAAACLRGDGGQDATAVLTRTLADGEVSRRGPRLSRRRSSPSAPARPRRRPAPASTRRSPRRASSTPTALETAEQARRAAAIAAFVIAATLMASAAAAYYAAAPAATTATAACRSAPSAAADAQEDRHARPDRLVARCPARGRSDHRFPDLNITPQGRPAAEGADRKVGALIRSAVRASGNRPVAPRGPAL